MSGKRYADEFKIEAVKQVTERGSPCRAANPSQRRRMSRSGM